MSPPRAMLMRAYADACRLEIEALKPGNVHVFADGHDMSAGQFLRSAEVTAAPLTEPGAPVGQRVLAAVRATREAVGANTNLGILLLSAPLLRAAELSGGGDLRADLCRVFSELDEADAAATFAAIALASPGGLGEADNDVREPPRIGLMEAMRQASGRDMIARQYASGMEDVFATGLAALASAQARGEAGMWPAVATYLAFLVAFPDSHVARKHGLALATEVQREAAAVNAGLWRERDEKMRRERLMAFDRRLKRRAINPGTSADLTVASLLAHGLGRRLA